MAASAGDPASINAASLARFGAWVSGTERHRRLTAIASGSIAASPRSRGSNSPSGPSSDRSKRCYGKALDVLEGLPFDMSAVTVERGRSALTPEVQKPFRDFMQSLLDDVVAFNRTSCALSNFPDEHHLSKEYVQTILRDIAAAWQEFSLSANRLLLAKETDAKPAILWRPHPRLRGRLGRGMQRCDAPPPQPSPASGRGSTPSRHKFDSRVTSQRRERGTWNQTSPMRSAA